MDRKQISKRGYSRRQILKAIPLVAAGGFVLGVVSGRLLGPVLRRDRQPPVFPEGSIFTPAKDREA